MTVNELIRLLEKHKEEWGDAFVDIDINHSYGLLLYRPTHPPAKKICLLNGRHNYIEGCDHEDNLDIRNTAT